MHERVWWSCSGFYGLFLQLVSSDLSFWDLLWSILEAGALWPFSHQAWSSKWRQMRSLNGDKCIFLRLTIWCYITNHSRVHPCGKMVLPLSTFDSLKPFIWGQSPCDSPPIFWYVIYYLHCSGLGFCKYYFFYILRLLCNYTISPSFSPSSLSIYSLCTISHPLPLFTLIIITYVYLCIHVYAYTYKFLIQPAQYV